MPFKHMDSTEKLHKCAVAIIDLSISERFCLFLLAVGLEKCSFNINVSRVQVVPL